ncbi:ABC transporter permease [Chloroflexi bacterium TSY]|nr:ABC transporter permease [Chloroflexi bacterium TSY]
MKKANLLENESANERPHGMKSRFWSRFRKHKLAVIGALFLLVLVVIAVFAPILSAHDAYELDPRATKNPPSAEHILGTDTAGRDLWTRLAFAGRVSLSVGLVSVSIYIVIGTLLGAMAAYYGGWVDSIIMRFTDTVMSFPGLIIIITVVSFIGPSIYNVMLAIGLLGWPGTCRLVRGQVLSLREIEFIEAAHSIGLPAQRVLWRHILPNVVPYLIVVATLGMATAILTEAGLSFLGLGVQPPTPSWGNMLHSAQKLSLLEKYPHLWLPPGLMIAVTVLSINFVGDALRDALDPRLTL